MRRLVLRAQAANACTLSSLLCCIADGLIHHIGGILQCSVSCSTQLLPPSELVSLYTGGVISELLTCTGNAGLMSRWSFRDNNDCATFSRTVGEHYGIARLMQVSYVHLYNVDKPGLKATHTSICRCFRRSCRPEATAVFALRTLASNLLHCRHCCLVSSMAQLGLLLCCALTSSLLNLQRRSSILAANRAAYVFSRTRVHA